MDLEILYSKVDSKEEAYQVGRQEVSSELIEKFNVSANLEYLDDDYKMKASGKGFELLIDFLDDRVQFELTLSLILRPLKKTILNTLEKQVSRII